MRMQTSNEPFRIITEKWWPTILAGTRIYWHEVVPDFIELELLPRDYLNLIDHTDKGTRLVAKIEENRVFTGGIITC